MVVLERELIDTADPAWQGNPSEVFELKRIETETLERTDNKSYSALMK